MITVFTFPQGGLPAGLAGSGCWNSAGRPLRWGGPQGRPREASSGRASSPPPRPTLLHGLARRRKSPRGPAGEGKAGLCAVGSSF